MENDHGKFFCGECDAVKDLNFCEKCGKDTVNAYKMRCEVGKYSSKVNLINLGLKRGDISWAYFPIAYGIILTATIGIIQLIEIIEWYYRIILIIIFALLFFYFCFFNNEFRRKIAWLFGKSKERVER